MADQTAAPQIDLSSGFVPKSPAPDAGGIDLSAGFVPKSPENVQGQGPAYTDPTKAAQPGFFERAYETSGIKGLVDQAKSKGDQDEAVRNEAMAAIKAGKYGHAAETLLRHVAGGAVEGIKGPAGQMIEGAVTGGIEHGKAAVQAARAGKPGEAMEQAAEAVPVVGQLGEQIVKPLATDIGAGNIPGALGGVAGAAGQLLLGKAIGKAAGTPAPTTGEAVSAEELAPKAKGLQEAGKGIASEAEAIKETAGKRVGVAKEAAEKSLGARPSPLLEKNGNLAKAAQKSLDETAEGQVAGAKDPNIQNVRDMADHFSKGTNAKGEPLNLDEENVESIKRTFDDKIKSLVAQKGNQTAVRHLKNLKSAYLDDVYEAYGRYGDPKAAAELKAANNEYARIIKEQTKGPARAAFSTQKPSAIIPSIVKAGASAQDVVESILNNSTEEGKQVFRNSVDQEIRRQSMAADGKIDGIKARKTFLRMGDAAKSLYGGQLEQQSRYYDAISRDTAKANKPSLPARIGAKLVKGTSAAGGAYIAGPLGAAAGGEIGAEAANAFFEQNGEGAARIGISPTEKIVLSPKDAAANRPLITRFLKAKSAGNPAAIAAAYNAIASPKQPNQ